MNKSRRATGLAIVLSSVLMGAGGAAVAAEGAPHWTYEGKENPAKWGDIDKEFATCKLGREQSPINITAKDAKKAALAPIKPAYKSSAGELVNNGHTIQINLADGGAATVPSGEYKLLQFHFHTPSEEQIEGKPFPLVAHLVHKNDAGKLAVIGVLFKSGRENAALKDIFAKLPAKEGKAPLAAPFDTAALLPKSLAYYTFNGSLTTPPCSEGVAWQVLKEPVEISPAQLAAFQKIFKMNARPVQPLNGRVVQASE
jgi:carbonic anhydrase